VRRLVILLALLLAGAAMARVGVAQQVAGVPRVGVLHQTSQENGKRARDAFAEGMRSLGWIEGSTVTIESRYANGDLAQLSANAAGFAAAKFEVIVAFSSLPAQAARQATASIPIVMDGGDPVAMGLVATLARPGGNVTGQSLMRTDMAAKQLQMLKEAVPRASKIGVLLQPDRSHAPLMTELERAAATLGVSVLPVPVGTAQDLPRLFDEMIAAGADAYLVLNEPRTDAMRGDIVALALRHRLPGAAQERRYAEAGVLFSYGVSLDAIHRRAAFFVDKILKGAKPADLPVEQPTKFELLINLKTAKALGLTVPQSLLARADEVIE
jgi:putative ABC transport system substrate-binding protein